MRPIVHPRPRVWWIGREDASSAANIGRGSYRLVDLNTRALVRARWPETECFGSFRPAGLS